MGPSFGRIDRIDDAFYICGVAALEDISRLHELGIRFILNVAQSSLYTQKGHKLTEKLRPFNIKMMDMQDAEDQTMSGHFDEMANFIEEGRQAGGVVVHCAGGISRASSACIAYLMMREGLNLEAAFRKVHRVRIQILPNPGFWRQLRQLETKLRGRGAELRELRDGELPLFDMPGIQLWEVVGGVGKGGVLVRDAKELSSMQAENRLSSGAVVREEELLGNRLHFSKVTGFGPQRGWISVVAGDRTLAKRVPLEALAYGTMRQIEEEAQTSTQSVFFTGTVFLTQHAKDRGATAADRLLASTSMAEKLEWLSAEALDSTTIAVRFKVPHALRSKSHALVEQVTAATLDTGAVERVDVEPDQLPSC
eukprot:TRINITY_DN42689_c0_g1_i1.p1 TRINITY_DN42689_c0_g1~~TRINITY_DN42689_c0_g1_i1.p1  ORF type:complete len:366 (-),score=46.26 TRINITY_DN42689_c0_g1_i1:324-1421(-)